MKIEYQKYSGAGNDFLIVNNLKDAIKVNTNVVKELISCENNRNFDGVIFLEESDIADFKMNYFNKDGTGNALCGNGLRCTVKYIEDNAISAKSILTVEAVSRIYKCEIMDREFISVSFPPPDIVKLNFDLKVHFTDWWQTIKVSFFEIGSPHVVIFIDDIENPHISNVDEILIDEWGRNIRMHKDFMPGGVNVNFVQVSDKEEGELKIRSYERGVEGETLACGTGAISSAIAAVELRHINKPVRLLTKSGEYLFVDFSQREGLLRDLTLTGGAKKI